MKKKDLLTDIMTEWDVLYVFCKHKYWKEGASFRAKVLPACKKCCGTGGWETEWKVVRDDTEQYTFECSSDECDRTLLAPSRPGMIQVETCVCGFSTGVRQPEMSGSNRTATAVMMQQRAQERADEMVRDMATGWSGGTNNET